MRTILAGAATLVLAIAVAEGAGPEGRGLEIYWVDVEGGAATLVVTPAGEAVLIDTGFPGDRDALRIQRVAELAGLARIDHVIVTHFHADHFGGLASLVRLLDAYRSLAVERRSVVEPGGRVELRDAPGAAPVRLEFLAASGQLVEPRVRAANDACRNRTPKAEDTSDNRNSVVSLLTFGRFRFFDGGDLTWAAEADLVCPRDRVGGPVDVYQVDHHGMDTSNNPVLLKTLRPTVAVLNNGPRKGGEAESLRTLRGLAGLRALYQLHKSLRVPEGDTEAGRIANAAESCDAHFIKLAVEPDASRYTVWVPSTGRRETYTTRRR